MKKYMVIFALLVVAVAVCVSCGESGVSDETEASAPAETQQSESVQTRRKKEFK